MPNLDDYQRMSDSLDDAQHYVPMLLALPAGELRRQMASHPDLRTYGVLHWLHVVAEEAIERAPRRTIELTAAVIRFGWTPENPQDSIVLRPMLAVLAWRDRADALRRLGRNEAARAAIAAARWIVKHAGSPTPWFGATVDLVEAPLLHDGGDHESALGLVHSAAEAFRESGDHGNYGRAIMAELWMAWSAGDRDVAARLLRERSQALLSADSKWMAVLQARIGLFELEHGDAVHAAELLASALEIFVECGLRGEAARTRWHMAEAAALRDRVQEAISELYKAQAELIEAGHIRDAALAGTRILELLLLAGRESAVAGAAETFVHTLDRRMPPKAFAAMTWLARRANAGTLTAMDVRDVGRYFEEAPKQLEIHPTAWLRRIGER